jgi:hypothetical protein
MRRRISLSRIRPRTSILFPGASAETLAGVQEEVSLVLEQAAIIRQIDAIRVLVMILVVGIDDLFRMKEDTPLD